MTDLRVEAERRRLSNLTQEVLQDMSEADLVLNQSWRKKTG